MLVQKHNTKLQGSNFKEALNKQSMVEATPNKKSVKYIEVIIYLSITNII